MRTQWPGKPAKKVGHGVHGESLTMAAKRQRLASCGVGFHSYTEPHLATDNELVRDILLALLASLAKQEAKRMSERVRAGMARAKAQGKHLGRPAISLKLKAEIAERIAVWRDSLRRGQGSRD
jgi:DNA invertase Pin-like site-specific DNA recombinase